MNITTSLLSFEKAVQVALTQLCGACHSYLLVIPIKGMRNRVFGYQLFCPKCLEFHPETCSDASITSSEPSEGSNFELFRTFPQNNEVDRFWSHVSIPTKNGLPNFDACWIWTRSRDKKGYGWFRGKQRVFRANRYAFWVSHPRQPLEGEFIAMHACDNPTCCSIAHLIRGTKSDNSQGMYARGRSKISKMNREKVLRLFEDRKKGASKEEISATYGIKLWQIQNILKMASWWYVLDDKPRNPRRRKYTRKKRK